MILRQPQFSPLPVEKQVAIIWTATNGWLDDIDSSRLGEFETGFYRFLESTHKKLLPAIAKEKALSDELTKELEGAVKEYREQSGFGKADEPAKAEAKPAESTKARAKADAPEAPAEEPASDGDADGEGLGVASLKEIRGRIASIRNISQITRAMELVAASRMKRAQEAILAARPYDDELRSALSRATAAVDEEVDPLLARRPVRKLGLIVMTTDRGLAGALDTNTVRAALRHIAEQAGGAKRRRPR